MPKFRLRGSPLKREYSETLTPYRVIFLSVEGKKTEPQYFRGLNELLARGKLSYPRCIIRVLDKDDDNSDPGSVISLLEDLFKLRAGGFGNLFPESFCEKYNIAKYFRHQLNCHEERRFEK